MAATTTGDVEYLDAQQVRRRYGARSAMWLWRCMKSEKDFPKPIKLHGRNYWRYRDLVAFEQKKGATHAA
jgi:predicted DNA-binding transcriptional regulator AlpA